jgi:hypothetical protein
MDLGEYFRRNQQKVLQVQAIAEQQRTSDEAKRAEQVQQTAVLAQQNIQVITSLTQVFVQWATNYNILPTHRDQRCNMSFWAFGLISNPPFSWQDWDKEAAELRTYTTSRGSTMRFLGDDSQPYKRVGRTYERLPWQGYELYEITQIILFYCQQNPHSPWPT